MMKKFARVGVLGLALLAFPSLGFSQSVAINEVMSSNASTVQDEDGTFSDWVELHNYGAEAVDLTGWGLSDTASNPFKWSFGSVIIQPGEFLMVWASNKNRPAVTNGNMLHTSFAISAGGEDVVLTHSNGTRIDALAPVALSADLSIGRQPDGTGDWLYFDDATPGAANTTVGSPGSLEPPSFSTGGGAYTSAVSVELSTSVTGGVVRYTLDGSEPTTNSPVYASPIVLASRAGQTNGISMIPTNFEDPGPPFYEGWMAPSGEVFKIHTVRAKVFKPGGLPSRPVTQSYLIDPAGIGRFSMPVMSLATDDANLFSNETGIYVKGHHTNYAQSGSAWERPGSLEFINTNGSVAFNTEIGVRINGNSTRTRPRKALRIYAKNPNTLPFQLFPDKTVSQFSTFLLRAGGNDWGNTIFRDAYMQSLVAHTGLDRQHSRPVVVFINGEYWGVHNIRDRFDEGYFKNHYGLTESDYVQLDTVVTPPANGFPIYDTGNEAYVADYFDLMSFVNEQGVVSTANYAAVTERIDIGNFADYYATEIYSGNSDWPGNNVRLWRSVSTNRAPDAPYRHDGRWRWMLFDTDLALGADFFYVPGHDDFAQYNALAQAASPVQTYGANSTNATLLFRRLLESPQFKKLFVTRFSDHLNTSFTTNRAVAQLNSMAALYAPEMAEHAARWGKPTNWSNDVDRIRQYVSQRNGAVWGHLRAFFALQESKSITVDVSDRSEGLVQVNSVTLDETTPGVSTSVYPWSGTYFPDYPVSLTATVKPGHRFVMWVDAASSNTLSTNTSFEITLTSNRSVRAIFEQDPGSFVPAFHDLALGSYTFAAWSSNAAAGTYPSNMIFEQTATLDPGLAVDMDSYWTLPYNLASRSRINGLDDNGVAFINTGNAQDLPGAGFVGTAIAAFSTKGRTNVQVTWTGGTVTPNVRVQAIRLQYRVGASGPFTDVLDGSGQPVEYVRNATAGHSQVIGPVTLPAEAANRSYIQLRWKYYFLSGASSARAQLRLDDILVTSQRVNLPPAAEAGTNVTVTLDGGEVTLDGSASLDSDGTIAAYQWTQLAGPSVAISNATQAVASVTIPEATSNTSYVFALEVTDNDGATGSDSVTVSQQAPPLLKTFPQVYLRGTPNTWGTTLMTLVSNYVWEIQASFGSATNERFKFDIYGDWILNYGDSDRNRIGDEYGADIMITNGAGDYLIRFNDQSLAYTVKKVFPPSPPVAVAGSNQVVYYAGEAVALDGSASYDVDGYVVSHQWTQLSGPEVILSGSNTEHATAFIPAQTSATTYVFALIVTDDSGLSSTGTVTVSQVAPPPLRTYPTMYLKGSLNGWSNTLPMTLVSNYVWEIQAAFGPSTNERIKFDAYGNWATNWGDTNNDFIGDPMGANIRVTAGEGVYTIRFNDQSLRYWLIKHIVNQPPVVNAGTNQTIALEGGNVTLNGSASFDNEGFIVSHAWSQRSGPVAIIANASNAIASASIPARTSTTTYVFALVVTDDGGLSSTGTVSVTQQAPPLLRTYPTMYFRGTPNGWSTNAMELVSNYVWEIQASFGAATNERFKFDAYGNWATNSNWGDTNKDFVADRMGSDILIGQGSGTYTIRFNDQNRKYWVMKNGAPFVSAYSNMSVAGLFNGWNASAKNMQLVADRTWTYDVVLVAPTEFKFAANSGWAINWGDRNPSGTTIPLNGIAETSAANIRVTSALNGAYRILFNESTRAFSMHPLVSSDPAGDAATTASAQNTAWERLYRVDLLDGSQRLLDIDGDGLDALRESYANSDPFLPDSDGDTIGDGHEVIAGTDAADSSSYLGVVVEHVDGRSFVRWKGVPGRTYALESCTDITRGAWHAWPGLETIDGAGQILSVEITDILNSGNKQFRLRVVEAPAL